jgi:hypothetical protein
MRRLFTLSALVAVLAALFCMPATAQTPNPSPQLSPAPSASTAQIVAMLKALLPQAPSDFVAIRGTVKQPDSFAQVWTVTDPFQAICPTCPTKILQGLPGPDLLLQPSFSFEIGTTPPAGSDPAASLQFIRANFLSWIPSSFAISKDPAQSGTIDSGGHFSFRFVGPNKVSIFIESYPTNYQNSDVKAFVEFTVGHVD